MQKQQHLRNKARELKIYQRVSYSELAEYIEISRNSFYNWLNGYYDLSDDKASRLNYIIDTLKEY